MTNELGTQLESFEDKAERKKSTLLMITALEASLNYPPKTSMTGFRINEIKKYIEEN